MAPLSGGQSALASFDVFASLGARSAGLCSPALEGQITPSHERSRHLKSGARGLRFVRRLSHIRPPHFGHCSSSSASAGRGWVVDPDCAEVLPFPSATLRVVPPVLRAYTTAGSSSGFAFLPSPSISTQFTP